MTSKTTYYAFDGTEFESYDDCVKYEDEQLSASVKMWKEDGTSTTNLDKAHIVYLPTEEAKRVFVDMSAAWNYITDGIDDCGWYVYNVDRDQYFPVDVDLLNTLFMLVSNEVNKIDDTATATAAKPVKEFVVDMKKIRSFTVRAVDEDEAIEVACFLADDNPCLWIDEEVDEFEVTPLTE